MSPATLPALEPPGIHETVARLAVRRGDGEGVRAAPAKPIPAIAAGFEFPSLFEEATVGLERSGNGEALLPTGRYHRRTEIIGIKQHNHLDAAGGREYPDALGC
jgi:hypothetical protein